jgi:hypothetical protein
MEHDSSALARCAAGRSAGVVGRSSMFINWDVTAGGRAASTEHVLDDDGLPERASHVIGDDARNHVGRR